MEMVMPMNYVEMTDDEMMYVDGGWSAAVFGKNLYGLAERGGVICSAIFGLAKALGKVNPAALTALTGTFASIASKVVFGIGRVAALAGGWVGFVLSAAAIGVIVSYLGDNRVFY